MTNTRVLRILLLATAALTFILVALGGFVRGTGAGLSCPDWPLCFGRIVPQSFAGGVAQEWIHRVLAKVVGVLCIASVVFAYRLRARHPRVFYFTLAMLGLVIVQGIFGGLTVLMLLNPFVVTTHLALGTLFFQLLILVALEPKQHPLVNEPRQILYHPIIREHVTRFRRVLLAFAALIYFQMLLGGFVGASGASLACPKLPLCSGLFGEASQNSALVGAKLTIIGHATLGTLILLLGTFLVVRAFWSVGEIYSRRHHLSGVLMLIYCQVGLGLATVHLQIPVAAAVAHLVLAQLILLGVASCYRGLNPNLRVFESQEELPQALRQTFAETPEESVGVSAAG